MYLAAGYKYFTNLNFFQKSWTFLHGAFGAALKEGLIASEASHSHVYMHMFISHHCVIIICMHVYIVLCVFLVHCVLWRVRCEEQPLRFFDREVFELLIYALRKLALFIGMVDCCPKGLIVFHL